MISRRALLAGVAAFAAAGFSASAVAQTYPDHPIKMIVPFPAGGPVDVTARIVAQALAPILSQPVVIENRGGASGAIGGKAAAAADPDGYTLMCGNISSLVVTPVVNNNRDYDPAKAFVPIAHVSQNHQIMVIPPTFPAKTVQEFVAYAKANPGKLNFGSPGPGNAGHLAAELFKIKTGIDVLHVPYKGAADALTAVMSGQVQMYFGDTAAAIPLIREGRVRALGWSATKRNPELPDVPTMIESGVPDYVVLTFIGIMAPARTPPAIVAKLNAAINQALRTPEVTAAAARLSAELKGGTPEEFGAFLAGERVKWSEVVRLSGIKVQ
jgi:tripartite-type tricarboxylate transporter receptor subunit TctC